MGEPEFDATNPETHHQAQLMDFIMSPERATVQTLIDGENKETVRHFASTITYEVYRLKGIEAKVNVETFLTMPEKLNKLEDASDPKTGQKRYTKEDIKKYIRAFCFNKCRAVKDVLATRDDFSLMAQYIENILFDGDEKLREKPPKGIIKSLAVSKYYNWETVKFNVKVSVESYVQLEVAVRKIKNKAKKEDILNMNAETKKVTFLQKSMRLIPGQYCSGAEFAAYFKEIFKVMYPKEFGTEAGLKKGVDGIQPKDEERSNPLEDGDEEPVDEPTPKKKSKKPKKK